MTSNGNKVRGLGPFRFTKSDRILNRKDFLRISRSGKRVHGDHFLAVYLPTRSETPRLGITVSKKVGKAVTRNRIKRFVREYYRRNKHGIQGRNDVNVIAKHRAAALGHRETFDALENLFSRISG